jgi:hypothetical protein
MTKKSSASSRPAGLKSMRSEDIGNKKWSERERRAVRRAARLQAAGDDSGIDFEDIPRLNPSQLSRIVRLRDARPGQQLASKQGLRIDPRPRRAPAR